MARKINPAGIVASEAAPEEIVTGIKGFDKDLKCRDFQFEIGKSYEHTGDVIACESGFHAISGHPLEVLGYYPPATSRYAEVVQSGKLARHGSDSKVASAKITIGVELHLHDLAQRAVKWVFDRANWGDGPVATRPNEGATASGDRGAATARGNRGAASASGDQGAATASGYHGAATASGYRGAATASGDRGAATASGYHGAATASGDQGAATASGYHGAATASGDRGAATASGYRGAATASGYHGAATASGYHGAATARGDRGAVRADKDGCALFLVYRDYDGVILHVWAGVSGRNDIKSGVWYSLSADGLPMEAA